MGWRRLALYIGIVAGVLGGATSISAKDVDNRNSASGCTSNNGKKAAALGPGKPKPASGETEHSGNSNDNNSKTPDCVKNEALNGPNSPPPSNPPTSAAPGGPTPSTAAPPPADVPNAKAFDNSNKGYRDAGAASRSAGDGYRADVGNYKGYSAADRGLAQTISGDIERINSFTQPRMASGDPQQRSEAEQFLQQQPSPSGPHADAYPDLGLKTNQDVVNKGPEYVNNLNDAADQHDKEASQAEKMAKHYDNDANQYDKMASTLNQRAKNMDSVAGQNAAANRNGGNLVTGSQFGDVAPENGTSQSNAASEGIDSAKFGSGGSGSGKGSEADGASDKSGGRGLASTSSLADKLRASLANGGEGKDASGNDGAGGKDPKSEFDDFFAGARNKSGKDAKGTIAEGDGAGKNGSGAFSMSGSDTDRAVKNLLGSLQGSDEKLFGDINQTIFQRMSKYLKQAQADKKVR
jgi:hypothetical protein